MKANHVWQRDCCKVIAIDWDRDFRAFEIYRLDGSYLGAITPDVQNYQECRARLDAGQCPVCEHWDDGLGHLCTKAGWTPIDPVHQAHSQLDGESRPPHG